jgi:hypothetical protein
MKHAFAIAAVSVLLLAPAASRAQQAPDWEQARGAILADYAKQQPRDKVLEVTGPERREAILLAVRMYGSALIERADGTRNRDRVLVEYRLVGDRWELARVRVLESTALSDVQPPSAHEAQKFLLSAWRGAKCEAFDDLQVAIDGEPRFQLETTSDRVNAKRWYVYKVRVGARGNGKFRESEDGASYVNETQNMLLWNPVAKSWSVEARHLRCTGFAKRK